MSVAQGDEKKAGALAWGMAMRFAVTVDGVDLGRWRSCKGLGLDFEVETVVDGGHYDYQVILPTTVKYTPIKLERAMERHDSRRVQDWLRSMVRKWVNGDASYDGATAVITLFNASNVDVASWTLAHVFPKSWKGPDLDAKAADFAIETLEFVHQGFL
ncbi:phage tail protein [Lentzea sp. NPDC059081]|uniref:phage tail protein n=1 Tax=Lentzea sp. NPDC059081 TaxID=3346719 RepID=UPI0036C2A4E0